jgi:hypothetical protein
MQRNKQRETERNREYGYRGIERNQRNQREQKSEQKERKAKKGLSFF